MYLLHTILLTPYFSLIKFIYFFFLSLTNIYCWFVSYQTHIFIYTTHTLTHAADVKTTTRPILYIFFVVFLLTTHTCTYAFSRISKTINFLSDHCTALVHVFNSNEWTNLKNVLLDWLSSSTVSNFKRIEWKRVNEGMYVRVGEQHRKWR